MNHATYEDCLLGCFVKYFSSERPVPERVYNILSETGLPTEPPFVEPAQEEFNLTRLICDEQKDLLIELDLTTSAHSDQNADPLPVYEESSQEPAEWHAC